jgi:Fe-S-cluster containining protein
VTEPRHCGDCQLCCRLLPMRADSFEPEQFRQLYQEMIDRGLEHETRVTMTPEFDKPAGERCKHQRHGKGCAIYRQRPFGCRVWRCMWLQNDTGDLPRPDRLHLVVDVVPDFVVLHQDSGEMINLLVLQVWIDPKHRDAHRDPAFRAWLAERSARTGEAALIRYSDSDAMLLAPPAISEDHEWHEKGTNVGPRPQHTPEEVFEAVGRKLTIEAS